MDEPKDKDEPGYASVCLKRNEKGVPTCAAATTAAPAIKWNHSGR